MNTPESIHERLRLVLDELGISQRQFAQELCLDPGYISRILQGKSALIPRLILLIEKTFNVNAEWLKTGEGRMFKGGKVKPLKARILANIDGLDERQLELLDSFIDYLKKTN